MPTTDDLLDLATATHRAGDLPEARRLYERALTRAPVSALARLRLGLLELQDDRPRDALEHLGAALAQGADGAVPHLGRGEALAALDRWDEAVLAYRAALEAAPANADAHYGLGRALQAAGDLPHAAAAYAEAATLSPTLAEASNNAGLCHQALGDAGRAELAYRRALASRPGYPLALTNLAALLAAHGRAAEAVPLARLAHEREPAVAGHAINLGVALSALGRHAEAEVALREARRLDEGNAEAAYNLGIALDGQGLTAAAADAYRAAVACRADHADALLHLGNAMRTLGRYGDAAVAYEAALAARPGFAATYNNAACLLRTLGRLDEAEQALRAALVLAPDLAPLHNNLGNVLKDAGALQPALAEYRAALALDPNDADAHGNLAYALSFEATDGRELLAECRRYAARFAPPAPPAPLHAPHAERRLRIGYVSADFRDHCQSLFTLPLLRAHDRRAVEVVCYSSVAREDALTREVRALADRYLDVRALDDGALADRIRADRVDVLVDLTMHMAGSRLGTFARRPAPVQVAWLAYPGTTGLDAIGYRLTDPRLDPPGADGDYQEISIRLPDTFWCYDPRDPGIDPGPLPALRQGTITFGCLNNPCKLTERTFALWAAVLRALPGSRLVLLAPPGRQRTALLARARAAGLPPGAIDCVPYRPRAEYLATYRQIDLGLDTLPYNGHTTSLDAFWMGVPVVSRIGTTVVGRAGASQLHQLGLGELACASDGEFVQRTLALARDLPRLAALRAGLRARMQASPLMDAPRFARHLEQAYRRMWRQTLAARGLAAPDAGGRCDKP